MTLGDTLSPHVLLYQRIVPGLYPAAFGYDTRGRLVSATTGSRTTTVAYDTIKL